MSRVFYFNFDMRHFIQNCGERKHFFFVLLFSIVHTFIKNNVIYACSECVLFRKKKTIRNKPFISDSLTHHTFTVTKIIHEIIGKHEFCGLNVLHIMRRRQRSQIYRRNARSSYCNGDIDQAVGGSVILMKTSSRKPIVNP